MCKAYGYFAKYKGVEWTKPRFRFENKLPKIPTEVQLRLLIDSASRRYRVIFTILMETGVMPVELSRVTRSDIDLQRGIIRIRGAKGYNSRNFKIKPKTLAMLTYFLSVNTGERSFPESRWISKCYREHRDKIAKRHGDSQLKTIRLYDFRHYFASMLYHKTKDILLVKERLGHKRIETTLIYARLVDFPSEEWTVRSATTIEEATALLEDGFEYVAVLDGTQLYRKRK